MKVAVASFNNPGTYEVGLRKSTKNVGQDSQPTKPNTKSEDLHDAQGLTTWKTRYMQTAKFRYQLLSYRPSDV
jgi:hypothetical protein